MLYAQRIDVHHHMASPSWLQATKLIGAADPVIANWSVQKSIEDMDKGGVATAVLSANVPQARPLDRDVAVRIARESNEYAKRLSTSHSGRFGIFAMLPLPHIDESLEEIAYALDTLKSDGIGILTNYGDKWLGYSYFDPIWDELNRRRATVYTHPADANCCVNLVQGVPPTAVEWGADTTRSITNLIFSGTSQKYRDINWIFSHGGGGLTAFAERLLVHMVTTPPYQGRFTREMVQAELDRFHYDTAQVSLAGTLAALAKLVPVSQIVYGTDFPYRTAAEHSKGVDAIFGEVDRKRVNRENALRILPRRLSALGIHFPTPEHRMNYRLPAALILLSFAVWGTDSATAQQPAGPPAAGVVRAERQQITQTDEFVGRVQAVGRVTVVARVTAFLEKRLFVEGSEVKKGELLYQLEQPPFQAQVDAAKANVDQLDAQHKNAQIALDRAKELLDRAAGPQSNYDTALANERALAAQIEGAKAQLQTAQINLGYTEIRAPIDGKISSTGVTEGNVVSPTSGTLASLVSQDPMYVIFPISQRAALDLRNRYANKGGFSAVVLKLRLPDGRIYQQEGRLDYVSPTVAENTDTITLRGVVPNPVFAGMRAGQPGARELTDGEFVTVIVEGVQPIAVLAIPRAAVLSDQQGEYVYVVDAQNKAQVRRIQLGQSTPSTAVVTNGLSEGELVITEGLQRVRAGQEVSAGPASPTPAIPPAVGQGGASGSNPQLGNASGGGSGIKK